MGCARRVGGVCRVLGFSDSVPRNNYTLPGKRTFWTAPRGTPVSVFNGPAFRGCARGFNDSVTAPAYITGRVYSGTKKKKNTMLKMFESVSSEGTRGVNFSTAGCWWGGGQNYFTSPVCRYQVGPFWKGTGGERKEWRDNVNL